MNKEQIVLEIERCATDVVEMQVGSEEWKATVNYVFSLMGAEPLEDVFWIKKKVAYALLFGMTVGCGLIAIKQFSYTRNRVLRKFSQV